ncbi:MAG: aldo/keto reductase [Candidatus Zixiibacteriota bacterium]
MKKLNSKVSRRKFISSVAAGLATASTVGLTPGLSLADDVTAEKTDSQKVITRQLGKNGPQVPIVSMGVAGTNNPGIVQAAYEKGIRHFDTASNYGYGSNEQMLGNLIAKLGVRDKVYLATKITAVHQTANLSAAEAVKKTITFVEGSLRRLKTDYIDVLYLHSMSTAEEVNSPAVIEGLAELKAQKKILLAGTSTHAGMADVINETVKHDIYDIVLTSYNFTYAADTELNNAIKNAGEKGVRFVAMKTQAGGGRWPNPESRQKYTNSVIMTAALKWIFHNKYFATSIPSMTNFDMLNEDFSVAYDIEFTEDERNFLNDNSAILSIDFCRQCRQCLAQCPHGADIPTLMRTHMYAARYGDMMYARQTYNDIPEKSGLKLCTNCDECTVECANTVNVKERLEELKLMYA